MTTLLISYDLHNHRNYEPVWHFLEQLRATRLLESLWILNTTWTAVQVRDGLRRVMDGDDSIAVIQLLPGADWGTVNAKPAGIAILQQTVSA